MFSNVALTQKGLYKCESGTQACIIRREIIGQKMFILYSAILSVSPCCQYHIDIAEITNGTISKRKLADYEHKDTAVKGLDSRVKAQNHQKRY